MIHPKVGDIVKVSGSNRLYFLEVTDICDMRCRGKEVSKEDSYYEWNMDQIVEIISRVSDYKFYNELIE